MTPMMEAFNIGISRGRATRMIRGERSKAGFLVAGLRMMMVSVRCDPALYFSH